SSARNARSCLTCSAHQPERRDRMNTRATGPTTTTTEQSRDPLAKGVELLDSLNTETAAKRNEQVEQAREALAPLIPQAKATKDELQKLVEAHGARLDTLRARDWAALRRRVPEPVLRALERTLKEARELLSSGIADLAAVPVRISGLSQRSHLGSEKADISWIVRNYGNVRLLAAQVTALAQPRDADGNRCEVR